MFRDATLLFTTPTPSSVKHYPFVLHLDGAEYSPLTSSAESDFWRVTSALLMSFVSRVPRQWECRFGTTCSTGADPTADHNGLRRSQFSRRLAPLSPFSSLIHRPPTCATREKTLAQRHPRHPQCLGLRLITVPPRESCASSAYRLLECEIRRQAQKRGRINGTSSFTRDWMN